MVVTCTLDRQNQVVGWFVGHVDTKPKAVPTMDAATVYGDLAPALSVARLMELRMPGSAWSVIRVSPASTATVFTKDFA
jgi:hypothetical protein